MLKPDMTGKTKTNPNSELSKAIAKLIPDAQLNATKLYEAVQAEKGRNLKEADYTARSWAAYADTKTAAEDYLDSLFDSTGAATAVNIAANQGTADGYATTLDTAYNALYLQSTFELAQEEIPELKKEAAVLFKQIDKTKLTAANYTNTSWTAFETAYAAAEAMYNKTCTFTGAGSEKMWTSARTAGKPCA